jgi:hypothetical protein
VKQLGEIQNFFKNNIFRAQNSNMVTVRILCFLNVMAKTNKAL